jgi:hypothetical protein
MRHAATRQALDRLVALILFGILLSRSSLETGIGPA